ncbi:glycosyltransferase family 4 protein [Priestia megaterium]|uniref:glycosyltransferase family 4 protein n=1 Tax=Priestia megaterium TaxID=1404 RepID=UPI003242F702
MVNKKISFIAQFPPPIHGLSKAVETLFHSEINENFNLEKIDITNNKKIFSTLNRIRKSNADLFYFTISQTRGGNLRDLIILKLLKLQKKRCLAHLHGGYFRSLIDNDIPKWQKKLNYKYIEKLDGVIVLSESLKKNFLNMIDSDKIHIVANCVDDEYLISDMEFENKINKLSTLESLEVLYLSNFIKSKGYLDVLEMAKVEKERAKNEQKKRLHFNFAGKFFRESEKESFFRYIYENDLQEFVTYHGVVSGQKKKDLLRKSHIFVLLSRYPNEGQPISILEAMGNGMVIITTNHAGIPDIVQNGINGLVCNEVNPSTIMNYLLNNEEIYEEVLSNNRSNCLNNYTQKRYVSNMKDIFEKL